MWKNGQTHPVSCEVAHTYGSGKNTLGYVCTRAYWRRLQSDHWLENRCNRNKSQLNTPTTTHTHTPTQAHTHTDTDTCKHTQLDTDKCTHSTQLHTDTHRMRVCFYIYKWMCAPTVLSHDPCMCHALCQRIKPWGPSKNPFRMLTHTGILKVFSSNPNKS